MCSALVDDKVRQAAGLLGSLEEGRPVRVGGLGQPQDLHDWITHATRADAPFLFLHVLSMGCRLSAGVLLWRLAPLGRWLHLVAWIVVLSEHMLGTREPKAIVAVVCGGLVVGAVLWRAEARVVFEPDYRDAVVMGMRVNRPKPLFWLAHVLLVLIAGLVVFRNLSGHF